MRYFFTVLHSNYFFLLSLFFLHFLLNFFFLSYLIFLILSLYDCDSLIKFGEQMREFRINLIDKVRKISTCFIINTFEKHNRCKIFLKILEFFSWDFTLKNINNCFFLRSLYLFSQTNHIFFQSDDSINISS